MYSLTASQPDMFSVFLLLAKLVCEFVLEYKKCIIVGGIAIYR